MPYFDVTIPYYHRFTVKADNATHALEVAHNEGNGSIIGYSDEDAVVEQTLELEPGVPPRFKNPRRKSAKKRTSVTRTVRGLR